MLDKVLGKLIVIEGPDGCGKQTQSEKLFARLKKEGRRVRQITFPDYESDSSALVKMYLKGDFGNNPTKINPYAAAAFYAVDRWASFTTSWGKWFLEGGIIIADRYVTSNMAHQTVKIADAARQDEFLEWLWDLEFRKFSLPVPDCVIFLNLPPEHTLKFISERQAKTPLDTAKQDIHEKNQDYLTAVYQSYLLASQKYGWQKIDCAEKNTVRSAEDIHQEIYLAIINKI